MSWFRSFFSATVDSSDAFLNGTLIDTNGNVTCIGFPDKNIYSIQAAIRENLGHVQKEWCSYKEHNGLIFWYDARSITTPNVRASLLAGEDLFGPILVLKRAPDGTYESFMATETDIPAQPESIPEAKRAKVTEEPAKDTLQLLPASTAEIQESEVVLPKRNGRAKRNTFVSPRKSSERLRKKL